MKKWAESCKLYSDWTFEILGDRVRKTHLFKQKTKSFTVKQIEVKCN